MPKNDKILLTIIVPFYCSEPYLEQCLSCFTDFELEGVIEVIAVNNDSRDGSAIIVQRFIDQYPGIFRTVIRESNGQHGAAINTGLDAAKGKYFRVVDSDDKVYQNDLRNYLDKLRLLDSDIVISNFYTIDYISGKKHLYKTSNIIVDREYTLNFLVFKKLKEHLACCTFHGITYRTQFLKDLNFKVTENTAFEDQEYATIPFAYTNRIYVMNQAFYIYTVGNVRQGGSDTGLVEKITDLEKILLNMVDFYFSINKSESIKKYLLYKIQDVLLVYYVAVFIKAQDRRRGRAQAKTIKDIIKKKLPEAESAIKWKYNVLFILSTLQIDSDILSWAKRSEFYYFIRRFI
jgi:glycosyltransferase involved in cell wall biosynthesis